MTNHKALSIFNQLRPVTVGFDNVFDHFERMFNDDGNIFNVANVPAFPHYNIVKQGKNKYDIEIALAGYNKIDITVNLEEGVLSIKSKKEEKVDDETKIKSDGEILHKGIAKRYFSKSFTIADDVKVKGAELKDGLLRVSMERIIPKDKQPRVIDIK